MSTKKFLLTSALVAGFATSALADTPAIKLGGDLDAQYGQRSFNSDFKYETPGDKDSLQLKKHALVHNAYININVDGKADNGLNYGGMVRLNANTSASKKGSDTTAEQMMIYAEGAFGHVELGSYTGATQALKVNAANFASATGGIDGDYRYWLNPSATDIVHAGSVANSYILTPNVWSNEISNAIDGSGVKKANANKITYYSPDFSGVKVGVSFTPDTEMHGTVNQLNGVYKKHLHPTERMSYKNVVEGGLQYSAQFDQVAVKAALVGQYGQAKQNQDDTINLIEYGKKRDLRAWEAGLNVNYMGVTAGASYGSWGKTDQFKDIKLSGDKIKMKSNNSHYWTAGLGYEYGPITTSLTYLNSERSGALDGITNTGATNAKDIKTDKNKADIYSLGLDYKLAPGFMPYAEVSRAKLKNGNQYKDGNEWKKYKDQKATMVLVGTKLHF